MTQKIKQIVIGAVVIIIAFVGFKMFFSKSEPIDAALVAEQATSQEFVDGQIILALLDKLGKVVLDETVFSNKTFVSLVSFDRELDGQTLERKNPFLPIGVEGTGIVQPRSTSTAPRR